MLYIGISSNCYAAGKTTLANNLVNFLNSNENKNGYAKVYSFAAALKNAADGLLAGVYGEPPFKKEKPIFKENGATYRDVLITLGQMMRSYDPDFWVKKVISNIETDHKLMHVNVAIIDDLRFPNEFDYIKQNKGLTFYINNRCWTGPAQNEAEGLLNMDSFDHVLIRTIESPCMTEALSNARQALAYIHKTRKQYYSGPVEKLRYDGFER